MKTLRTNIMDVPVELKEVVVEQVIPGSAQLTGRGYIPVHRRRVWVGTFYPGQHWSEKPYELRATFQANNLVTLCGYMQEEFHEHEQIQASETAAWASLVTPEALESYYTQDADQTLETIFPNEY